MCCEIQALFTSTFCPFFPQTILTCAFQQNTADWKQVFTIIMPPAMTKHQTTTLQKHSKQVQTSLDPKTKNLLINYLLNGYKISAHQMA